MAKVQVDAELLRVEKVVQLKPVSKTVKGGRKRRFASLIVVGDANGHVGVGMGKSASVPDSIRKGSQSAAKNLVEVALVNTTIPHAVIGRAGSARVLIKPASPGTGVIAGPAARAVLEAVGITDVLTKEMGCDNTINNVYATLDGLRKMQKATDVAKRRGIGIEQLAIPAKLKDASLYEPRQPNYITEDESQIDEKSNRQPQRSEGNRRGPRSAQAGRGGRAPRQR
jgi:small subunit ribosomal protein S5